MGREKRVTSSQLYRMDELTRSIKGLFHPKRDNLAWTPEAWINLQQALVDQPGIRAGLANLSKMDIEKIFMQGIQERRIKQWYITGLPEHQISVILHLIDRVQDYKYQHKPPISNFIEKARRIIYWRDIRGIKNIFIDKDGRNPPALKVSKAEIDKYYPHKDKFDSEIRRFRRRLTPTDILKDVLAKEYWYIPLELDKDIHYGAGYYLCGPLSSEDIYRRLIRELEGKTYSDQKLKVRLGKVFGMLTGHVYRCLINELEPLISSYLRGKLAKTPMLDLFFSGNFPLGFDKEDNLLVLCTKE